MKRQPELDFIRGVAILLVVNVHSSIAFRGVDLGPVGRLQNFGWAGVDVFFVLSGFLVGGLLCKEWKQTGGVKAGRFLLRRGFKIWPAYYAFFLFQVLLHRHPLSTFFWPNLLNIQNYILTPLGVTWSLAVEEHFYILLSFSLAWLTARQVTVRSFFLGCMTVALLVAGYRTYLAIAGVSGYIFYYRTHTRLDALLLGVLLAILFHFYREQFLRLQSYRLLLGTVLAFCVGVLLWLHADDVSGATLIASEIGSVCLLLLLYRPSRTGHTKVYRWVAAIGVYSYGIYLWHSTVIDPLSGLLRRLPPAAMYFHYPLNMICGIVIGIVMTKLIEFPFLRLRERFLPANPRYELKPTVQLEEATVP